MTTIDDFKIEDFRIRREIKHGADNPGRRVAVVTEMTRRLEEGPPAQEPVEGDVEEAIDRWLDPESVSRSLIRHALWEMNRHYWTTDSGFTECRCGWKKDRPDHFDAMRRHKENVLAEMLGLTIRPDTERTL